MALEERAGLGKRYWYRARRVNGRIKNEYVGSTADPVVEFAHRQERLVSAEREAVRRHRDSEHRNWHAAEDELRQYRTQIRKVTADWLILNGLLLTRRGVKRIGKHTKRIKKIMERTSRDEFEALLAEAESGDVQARKRLRMIMFDDAETFLPFGDLTQHVQRQYIAQLARGNIVAEESIRMSIAELTRSLKGPNASIVMSLAADEVVINYLHLRYQQMIGSVSQPTEAERGRVERRIEAARKRYEDVLSNLALIKQAEASQS